MIENERKQKDEWWWERTRVRRVLDYHNKKYGTHIEIIGRTTDIYHLEGKTNWDWVCRDNETNEEIAVEVKKLTDEQLEGRQNTIRDILEEIQNDLSNKLPGTFFLVLTISPENYSLPLRGHQNKQRFKDVLREAIFQTAQKLKLKEEQALTPQIIGQLPFALPDPFCVLHKFSDEGSALYKSHGFGGVWSPRLNEDELEKFEKLISKANDQLKKANVKETFLVIIEEGRRITVPGTIPDAFERISHNSYSHVGHAYCMSSEDEEGITEIPLPSS